MQHSIKPLYDCSYRKVLTRIKTQYSTNCENYKNMSLLDTELLSDYFEAA